MIVKNPGPVPEGTRPKSNTGLVLEAERVIRRGDRVAALVRCPHLLVRHMALPLMLAVALAGCGQSSSAPSTTASPRTDATTSSPTASSSPLPSGRVIPGAFAGPELAITTTGVYLAWWVSPPVSGVRTELARIDVASGRITATRLLGSVYFDQAVVAGGSLWVATSSRAGEAVVRLNPQTLAVTGRRWVGGRGNQGGHVLAVADSWLWVAAGNRLLRLSLPGGTVTATVPLPGATTSQVAASNSGTILIVAEATSVGFGILQRRDPTTGALLASSHVVQGVAGLFVGGVIGSGVWVSNVTGLMGYVERFDSTTLAPNPGTQVKGTNGITVRVADGLVWVYPGAGGPGPVFCGDPSSGRALARLNLPQVDRVLAIGPDQLFYAAPAPNGNEYVEQEPLPGGCQVRLADVRLRGPWSSLPVSPYLAAVQSA